MVLGTDKLEVAIGVLKEEFTALKGEVDKRVATQFQIVFFNFTVAAGDATLVYQAHANVLFLLLIPPLSLTLGLLWLEHLNIILSIGRYIRDEQWTYLHTKVDAELPCWERHYARHVNQWTTGMLAAAAPVGVFALPGLFSLVFAAVQMDKSPLSWTLVSLTCSVTVVGFAVAGVGGVIVSRVQNRTP